MGLPDLDVRLFLFVNRDLRNPVLDLLMPLLTQHAALVLLPLVLWHIVSERQRAWRPLAVALLAVLIADGSSHLLKDLFRRQRPCMTLGAINLLVGCGRSFSMPSSHAANTMAFAVSFLILGRRMIGAWLAALAALVGFSRISVGVHYPADVLVGAVAGAGAASLSAFLARRGKEAYDERAYGKGLLLCLAVVSVLRFFFILTGPFDLSPDEAHYWEWARRPDWSYYSKGPMVAYLILAGTSVFGNTEFGVRFFAVVFSAMSSLLLYAITRERYDEKTAFCSALLVQIVPLYSVFGMIFTIDSPFLFFWILSLFIFHRITAIAQPPHRQRSLIGYWLLLGVVAGLGLLTKYTMAIFFLCALLFLLVRKEMRWMLATPGPYAALLLAGAVFSPVLIWNAAHGWVTVKHTAGQAHISEGITVSVRSFLEFAGSQLGIITPFLFVLLGIALWTSRRELNGGFLFWFSYPVFLFFLLKSIQGKVQANWAITAYAPGLIAFSRQFLSRYADLGSRMRKAVVLSLLLPLLVTVLAHFPAWLPLPPERNPAGRLLGWEELGREVSRVRAGMTGRPVFIFSDSYQVAGELAFYMEGNPVTYCANLGRRMNQYDLWPGFEGFTGQDAIYVRTKEKGLQPEIASAFGHCDRTVVRVGTKKGKGMQFTIFQCYDFRGMNKRPPESY